MQFVTPRFSTITRRFASLLNGSVGGVGKSVFIAFLISAVAVLQPTPTHAQENGLKVNSNGAAQVADGSEIDFGPDGTDTGMTIEFWLKHSGNSDADAYLINKGSGNKGYLVRLIGSGNMPRLAVDIGVPSAFSDIGDVNLRSTRSIPANQWVHVAVVNNPDGDLSIFLNGELEAVNTGFGSQVGGNDEDLYIGSSQGTSNFLDGQIDDVRIWKTNRFSFQIENNYLQELSDPGGESNLVGYYPFDSQSDGQTPDLGGSMDNSMELLGSAELNSPGALPTPPRTFATATTDAITASSEATVSWEPRTSGDGDNEASEYRVYRSDSPDFPSGSTTQIDAITDGSTTFTDTNVPTDALSYYGVASVVDGVESGIARAAVAKPSATAGNALDLTGTSGFADVDIPPNFANSDLDTGTFTIEFWVKHDGNSDTDPYIVNKGSGGQGYLIRLDEANGPPKVAVGIGTNNAFSDVTAINLTSNQGIPANRWTHVAVTNNSQENLSVYVNGELDASTEGLTVGDNESPLRLGTNTDASSNFLSGQLDNVRFWKTVRTESEIQSSLQDLPGSQGSLTASFRFHEEGGSTARSSARKFTTLSLTGDVGFTAANRAGIVYTVENAGVSADGNEYTFEVHALGELSGRRIGTSSVVLDYNESGFGQNVGGSGAITVARTGLLDKQVDGSDVYSDATVTDLSSSRVRIGHEYLTPETPSDAAEVPGPSQGSTALFEVSLDIQDPDETAGLSLVESGMLVGTFRGNNATIFPEVRASDSDDSTLPVELADFDATVNGDEVRLSWTTASETNNADFRVQRRVGEGENGRERKWKQVGRVDGSGTTTEAQSYRYVDADLPYEADALTYRLKQVDTDGSAQFSNPVTVERSVDEVELLGTYPNPASQRATVRYALPEKQEVAVRLYDALGRQVQTVAEGMQEGRHEQRLDLSGLPSGVYFLRLSAQSQTRTQKLTVVR